MLFLVLLIEAFFNFTKQLNHDLLDLKVVLHVLQRLVSKSLLISTCVEKNYVPRILQRLLHAGDHIAKEQIQFVVFFRVPTSLG